MPQNQDKLILQDKRPVLYDDYESLINYDESIVEDCISSLLGGDVFVEPCEMTISGGKFKALSGKGFYNGHFFDVSVDSYCTNLTTFPNVPGTSYVFYFYMDDIVDYNDNNIILLYEKNNFIYDYKKTIKVIGQTITPDSLSEAGGKLKVYVNSLFQSAAEDHSGQTVQIWLNTPVLLDKDVAIERCVIDFDGGGNYIETVGLLGQSSPASTTPADYSVALLGFNWTSGIPPVDCIEVCGVTTGVFSYIGQSASDSISNIHDSLKYAIEDSVIYGLTSSKVSGMLVNISEGMIFSEGRHIAIPAFTNFDCSGITGSTGWIILNIGSFTPECVNSLATYDINTQILAYVTVVTGAIDKLIDCRKLFKLNRGAKDYVTVGQVTDGETLARANFANPYGSLFYNELRNANGRPLADIYLLISQDISAMTGKLDLDLKTTIYGKGSSIVLTGNDATNVIAINASQCRLENFSIKNNDIGAAIKIDDSLSDIQIRRVFAPNTTLSDYFLQCGNYLSDIVVEYCDFYFKDNGIELGSNSSGIFIRANFMRGIAGCFYGIYSPYAFLESGAYFENNYIYTCTRGIDVGNVTSGELLKIFKNKIIDCSQYGIFFAGNNSIIEGNYINFSGSPITANIYLAGSFNEVRGNICKASCEIGLSLVASTCNVILGNEFYSFSINGLFTQNISPSNVINSNLFVTSTTVSCVINFTAGSSYNSFCGNVIKAAIVTDIVTITAGSDYNTIIGNVLYGSTISGSKINDSGSNNIHTILGSALNT